MFVGVRPAVFVPLILITLRQEVCSTDPSNDPETVWATFQDFITTYSKSYSEQDKVYRFQVFQVATHSVLPKAFSLL